MLFGTGETAYFFFKIKAMQIFQYSGGSNFVEMNLL